MERTLRLTKRLARESETVVVIENEKAWRFSDSPARARLARLRPRRAAEDQRVDQAQHERKFIPAIADINAALSLSKPPCLG